MGDWQRETAERVVDGLLTNGGGEKATRLVLWRDSDGANLGGWGRHALEDHVVEAMQAQKEFGSCDTCDENSEAAVKAWGRVSEAERSLGEALALLEREEWNGRSSDSPHCPTCLNWEEIGHEKYCERAALLAKKGTD